jgi:polyketide biosynthesis enoyl-CoA hydratase PksI
MNTVVSVNYHNPFIAEVTMEEKTYRNTFSSALIHDLQNTFSTLNPETKVVVIHGYENYFCCGGTQEELIKISEGKMNFADLAFYRLLLDCPIPTISAMQGHALGGGLAFGCYADIIIMAEESFYTTNFMKYGFTPGMGATYIIPLKLGLALGTEMLFSAENYQGSELKQRGVSPLIVKKQEVISTALTLAQSLAEKPLVSLQLLKKQLSTKIKEELPLVIEKELAMHEVTFKLPEVKENIAKLFGK